MLRIAILGAECTGKSALAQSLARRLSQPLKRAVWVPELLREWCDRAGRTPQMHEQKAIAEEQTRLIDAAPPCDFLLVDSPPLMTAIYSDVYFSDLSLYPAALQQLRHYPLILLMAIDLDWVADGIQRDGPAMRQKVNNRLRQVLDEASLPYTVVYGTGPVRANGAMRAIESLTKRPHIDPSSPDGPWVWHCDHCSDANCERRMFTDRLGLGPT